MRNVLGLDIGVSSVGWGIIDIDSGNIVDAGVRLFTEAAKKNNEERRGFRSSRRLKRRRVNRKKDLTKLLQQLGLYCEYDTKINPYDARIKGLKEKISLEELNAALFHICKHRGSSLEVVEDEKEAEDGTKKVLADNDSLVRSGLFVCEIQKQRLTETGSLRGIQNNFRSSDYEKELLHLLKTQEISEPDTNEIINCILRRRHFSDGPGSFKSQTIYGKVYNEDGSVKENMIEKMTGKCSIFPDELRAPKNAPSAEFYNLMNDLNNLKVDDEPLDVETKQNLIKLAYEKGKLEPAKLAKMIQRDLVDITGFRIDENAKPLLSKLDGFSALKKVFTLHGVEKKVSDFKLLDQIAVILTKTKVKEERINEIKDLGLLDYELINDLSEMGKFKEYHSLSLKALYLLNDELYNTQLNQMQILTLSNKFEFARDRVSQKGKRNIGLKDDAILSSVAMRAYRQAIKVVNAARKRYGEFDTIVVETTRAKNSADEKKRIQDTIKFNKKINDQVDELLKPYKNVEVNGKLKTKIRLYLEQDCQSAYTQQPVDLKLLITDPYAYEIDHIIPISISLDDSINNKVLTTRLENQEKGQLTPVMAFEQGKFSKGSLESYKLFAKHLANKNLISWKKYNNYVYAKDINKYANMKEFIARNLVDTSYANRLVFNTLSDYFKDNEIDTKVHTIKGSATSAFRKRIKGLEKDRDADFSHHAIDALIVASIKKLGLYDRLLRDFEVTDKEVVYRRDTGEIIESNEQLLLDPKYISFVTALTNYQVTKYSHQIDTKPNRSISDQTIYSTRTFNETEYLIKKYKDIYDPKFFKLAEDIVNGNDTKYLMARNDPQTFERIKKVVLYYYEEYKNTEKIKPGKKGVEFAFNPLRLYYEENGEYITKYAKKDNGPVVTSLKYIDSKIPNHIDISNNYKGLKDKKVVLLQISPYRTDFYFDKGVYKFVTVRYSDIRYSKEKKKYVIDANWYAEQKSSKGISNDAQFCFSEHHGEYLYLEDDKKKDIYKYVATKNDRANVVELKPIFEFGEKRITPTIGKGTKKLMKYSCDALGNLTEIADSVLKLEFE